MDNIRANHLEELDNNSDYKIADGQPNIKNWKIVDNSGRKVGKVKDLLFDKKAMKVRYIVTNLKDGELVPGNRNVLIPIGKARLNKSAHRVEVANVKEEHIETLPDFRTTERMTQEDEFAVRNSFAEEPVATDRFDRNTFYEHEDFNEDRFYNAENTRTNAEGKVEVIEEDLEVGKRKVETGGAKLSSRIVERPVEEKVRLKEEHVKVNRKPVDRPATEADLENYEEKTIEARETEEVPVVKKEARVTEEVSLEKEVENKEEVIRDKVRHTEVDVENLSEEEKLRRERDNKNRKF